MSIRYLSLCSGIEAFSCAVHDMPDFVPMAFSEIEPFPCKVLAHHYPDVPNLGDMTKINGAEYAGTVQLVVGGTPCQDFSVAGTRKGLAGERSGLALKFVELVASIHPRWLLWENVPGAFSTNNGLDFARFVSALAECGYHLCWRVLDAQYFGVPQRRRRIFLVGHFADWRAAAAVLFERESLRGDTAKSRKEGKEVASAIGRSIKKNSWPKSITATLDADFATKYGQNNQHINSGCSLFVAGESTKNIAKCLTRGIGTRLDYETDTFVTCADIAPTVTVGPPFSRTGNSRVECDALVASKAVRRLTPMEAERLQGFPDNYTNIPGASDTARYKALGNSMAVPCMRWIAQRMLSVDNQISQL